MPHAQTMPHVQTPHRRKGTPTTTKSTTRGAGRKRVTVELRRELAEEWRALGRRTATQYLEQAMVLALVRSHRITASRGAELLGLQHQDFLDLLAANDVAVLDYRPGEVAGDVMTIKRWFSQRSGKVPVGRRSVLRRGKPRGSPAAVLHAMRGLPEVKAGDVSTMERMIELGKRPMRAEGIFDAGSPRRR